MFSPLSALGGLVEIQVLDNPLCTTSSGYKEEMKELIPNLEVVDGVSEREGWVVGDRCGQWR